MKNLILRLAKEDGVEEILEFTDDSNIMCRYLKKENRIFFNINTCRSSFENLKDFYFIDFKNANTFAEVVFQFALSFYCFRNLCANTREQYNQKCEKIRKNFLEKRLSAPKEEVERFLQIIESDNLEKFERKQWAKNYKFMRKKRFELTEQMKVRAKEVFEHGKMEDYKLIFDFGDYNGQIRFDQKEIAINLPSCYYSYTSSKSKDPCDFIELIVAHELGHALDRKRGTYAETNFDFLFEHIKKGFYNEAIRLYEGYMTNRYKNEINAWNLTNLFIKNKIDEETILFEIEESLKRSRNAFEKEKAIFMKTYFSKVFEE